jgi:aminoglycoside phosphotransferase (APT) family kinase protein
VPDGRLDAAAYERVASPFYDTIDGLRELIEGLPERLAEAAACGLPDTLVHGDLHPGNVRSLSPVPAAGGELRVIMDWGDASVGSPVFDILRLTGDLDEPSPLIEAWVRRWLLTVPGSDPGRAIELLAPVEELRAAAAYANFLANIEPAEWPYHAADVPDRLGNAVTRGQPGRERPTVGP